ncbi:UDP-N-acetylmuramate dehydrogenase [Desulfococcaceae bacterium HSG8]|nr:UDP-N-acetylmuramate dehydrogenase [Desulfococcaceae bacterium HSG8]
MNINMDTDSKKWLTTLLGKNVRFDEPMSGHTSFRVGGLADVYAAPENLETLKALISWAMQKSIQYTIIGGGTNLLVRDGGIRGIVIVLTKCLDGHKLPRTETEKDRVTITVRAGMRLQNLCRFAIADGLKGMNFALGIPGTVGGAVRMNAGTAYGSMETALDSVNVLLPTGQVRTVGKKDMDFEYRKLSWNFHDLPLTTKNENRTTKHKTQNTKHSQPVILDGKFTLYPADPEKLKKEAEDILRIRRKKQPTKLPSAGCFFKNPSLFCKNGVYRKSAGELIDLAGLKGKRIGGAEISPRHANFIINRDRAKAADILALAELARETVSEMFDVKLEPEVKIIGEQE